MTINYELTHDFAATTHDLTLGFAYNPASQIVEATRSNNLYAWTGHGSGTTNSTANGLNQLAAHGGATPTHDSRGNLTSDGTFSFTYSSENLMTSGANSGALGYDPLMRFYESYGTYFIHEGGQLVGEYYNGNIAGRYVPGAADDEPVALIDKFGARTGFHADERGSIIAGSNAAGANSRIVTYDEYGKRGTGGSYRFAYTGQVHLINDIYDYKARNYNARLGRFLQTDPIGYGDGMNMYAYVGGDPINASDPSGLTKEGRIVCTGTRITNGCGGGGISNGASGFSSAWAGGQAPTGADSLANLGISTAGMSNAEIRNLAFDVLGVAESLAASGAPRDMMIRLGYSSGGLSSLIPVGTPGFSDAAFQPLLNAAESAFQNNGMNSAAGRTALGWLRGIRIHSMFAASVNALGPMYHAEVSYKNGVLVPYGTPGSIRADAIYGSMNRPIFAVELKSGWAYISRGELDAYRRNLPPGTGVFGITERP